MPLLRLFILLKGYHIFTDIFAKNSLDFLFENFFSVHYNSIDIIINCFEEYKISREYGNDPSIRTFFSYVSPIVIRFHLFESKKILNSVLHFQTISKA